MPADTAAGEVTSHGHRDIVQAPGIVRTVTGPSTNPPASATDRSSVRSVWSGLLVDAHHSRPSTACSRYFEPLRGG